MKKDIRIAFSPDSDDLFMFYAILENKIDTKNYNFIATASDTEKLNEDAIGKNPVDVTAISIHAYPYLADNYYLLPHGGSVGNNYGPVLVSPKILSLDELDEKRIAIPGLKTTAYLVLRLINDKFEPNVIPIEPFTRIFEELNSGSIDAGLVIHEGRLTYETQGMKKIVDIGEWWYEKTKLPLALGGNIIRKNLGEETIKEVSEILRQSIRYALDNKQETIDYIVKNDPRQNKELKNKKLLDKYLDMYANEQTYDYGDDGKKSVQVLLDMGYEKGIIPKKVKVEFSL
jgi:1,4-dihydroxy-6-naphthoate synthase